MNQPTQPDQRRSGAWIIGALGDIATTMMVGTHAIRRGLASDLGLVCSQPPLDRLDLVALDGLVFGGCDIRQGSLIAAATSLADRSRTFPKAWLEELTRDLRDIDADIVHRHEYSWTMTEPAAGEGKLPDIVASMRRDLRDFIERHRLDHVTVVNLASAEPLPAPVAEHASPEGIALLIEQNRSDALSPSMCFAYAAFLEGCSHVNFTSSTGAAAPGLLALAEAQDVVHYGNDGKTGETLIKTTLAPMFAMRHLEIMSWYGVNLLGNSDGETLSRPQNRAGKIANKDRVLKELLGYPLDSGVTIDYVPSLGDWKTAWDLIHFRGFLDVPMTMQFTWQGCDSILAAPLVIDLVRLCEFAARQGQTGLLRHLASFFKNPLGERTRSQFEQYEALIDYARRHHPPDA